MGCEQRGDSVPRRSSVPLWRTIHAVGEQKRLEEVEAALEISGAVVRKVALHERLADPEEHGRLAELEVLLSAERNGSNAS
jgi:hypothetical protein